MLQCENGKGEGTCVYSLRRNLSIVTFEMTSQLCFSDVVIIKSTILLSVLDLGCFQSILWLTWRKAGSLEWDSWKERERKIFELRCHFSQFRKFHYHGSSVVMTTQCGWDDNRFPETMIPFSTPIMRLSYHFSPSLPFQGLLMLENINKHQ